MKKKRLRYFGIGILFIVSIVYFFWQNSMRAIDAPIGPSKISSSEALPAAPLNKAEIIAPDKSALNEKEQASAQAQLPIKAVSSFELSPEEIKKVRSEMKVSLAALYAAQKSFFSEYGRYSTDLNALGYSPHPKNQALEHRVGFIEPFVPANLVGNEDPRLLDNSIYTSRPGWNDPLYFRKNAEQISLSDYRDFCRHRCTASQDKFEMLAVTKLVEGYPPEIWLINERKELLHLQDGTLPEKK